MGNDTDVIKDDATPNKTTLTDAERRAALASLGKFAAITGPGIITLLASEQAVASMGNDDPECGKLPVC